ncbi:cation:proton antiporter [Chryseobacterium manosquense]|uniref:cation:proton antiporter n=1 Tax=Chryseobacterium manosquense TaxID=2754694 RepID=UPI001E3DC365|nr:cation:proton antiporter [Chryseobacterium manosquense]
MGHLPKLIEDLALILIVAAFVVLIFRKIKQPLVLGYIIAGFLVSPNFKIFPSIADSENIKTLAEIGKTAAWAVAGEIIPESIARPLGKYVGPYGEEIIKQNLGIKVSIVEEVVNLNSEKGGK